MQPVIVILNMNIRYKVFFAASAISVFSSLLMEDKGNILLYLICFNFGIFSFLFVGYSIPMHEKIERLKDILPLLMIGPIFLFVAPYLYGEKEKVVDSVFVSIGAFVVGAGFMVSFGLLFDRAVAKIMSFLFDKGENASKYQTPLKIALILIGLAATISLLIES